MSGVVVDCDTGAMIQANGDDRVDVDKDVVAPQSLLSDAVGGPRQGPVRSSNPLT